MMRKSDFMGSTSSAAQASMDGARTKGDDLDFRFFWRNPGRRYRVRKALKGEEKLPFVLVRCTETDGKMTLAKIGMFFDPPPPDTDSVLDFLWLKFEVAHASKNPDDLKFEMALLPSEIGGH